MGLFSSFFSPSNSNLVSKADSSSFSAKVTTGFAMGANFDYISGGYIKVGKMVTVSLHVKSKAAITTYVDVISGLPKPMLECPLSIYTVNSQSWNNTVKARVLPYSSVGLVYAYGDLLSVADVMISGAYIAE
jgi:hypothetical protein